MARNTFLQYYNIDVWLTEPARKLLRNTYEVLLNNSLLYHYSEFLMCGQSVTQYVVLFYFEIQIGATHSILKIDKNLLHRIN